MKTIFYLLITCFTILYACGKKQQCITGGMNIHFQGFDTLALDTVTIKSFTPNSSFNEVLSKKVIVIQDYNNAGTNLFNGTINLIDHVGSGVILSDKDWEISFTNKVYRIHSIKEEQKTSRQGGIFSLDSKTCYDPIIEYTINNTVQQNAEDNFITIQK